MIASGDGNTHSEAFDTDLENRYTDTASLGAGKIEIHTGKGCSLCVCVFEEFARRSR